MENREINFGVVVRQTGLMLLFVALFNRFISMTFVLNFTTAGVNSTLLFVFLTLSSFSISRIQLNEGINQNLYWLVWALFTFLSVVATIDNALLGSLASGLALQLMGILLLTNLDLASVETRTSLVLATAGQYLIYAILGGLYVFSTELGKSIYYLVLLVTTLSIQISPSAPIPKPGSLFLIYPYLNFLLLFLGVPSLVATWTFDGALVSFIPLPVYIILLSVIMSLSTLVAFIYPNLVNHLSFGIVAAVYSLALLDVLLLKLLVPVSIGLIIYIALSLISATRDVTIPMFKQMFFVQQFLITIFLFLYVSAGNWAFLPSFLGVASHGLAWFYLFLSGLLVVGSIVLTRRYAS